MVVVCFIECEATVHGIVGKVQDVLGSYDPVILTDAQGNEILDSEGTKGTYYNLCLYFLSCLKHQELNGNLWVMSSPCTQGPSTGSRMPARFFAIAKHNFTQFQGQQEEEKVQNQSFENISQLHKSILIYLKITSVQVEKMMRRQVYKMSTIR